ncbi:putative disease resistance RPP13-like protein 1 isoform X1 [Quercus lobata]|uniref:putative disease resistance RPP13-like protein 1 isoform X1 n=1 Tax=Quercus lobata TaxID=97700 RepID=UPI001246D6B3|nr:putative disease resistance RPP13-like protein 1 isoform X1 [Quercus lobata]XP_030952532.1 putative disease resistance RPP13-like protein 1 isoform X1 [Quercus lobata]XP_030952533.1 putative disease resistance RPP13-like protein 1 isoform X1 [Quercus lobata]XP_030952535.1 putative disease resistance RPP13-like protein 1 isoform X1 [Quercus lobata]XP_030952536.1 putative disease resistance RPP13-like protein 1 isoform X1 [Quercus lobata]XP_030952537.1 putative disease resistance RPP13-like p
MSIVAEVVAGAALSAFFDKLFDKFSSSDLLKTFRKENFDADLKKWESMLLKIQLVLDDAEEKQLTSRLVKIWLDELEDLAYDVDDILDEFATEALRRQLNPEPKSDFVKQMRSKIEGIDRRLQEIVEEKKDLELRENTGRRTITKTSRPPSTSLVNESRTYGRDEDKMKIVKLLLESSDAQLSVIPIVGMGGLGKTTLAQLVYKDDEVSRHFQLKAWVCVSEDFDNLRLTKEILHSTSESWTELCKPFEFGAQGSKIVVTTRNDDVSSIMGTTPPYKLKELSRDACLRVFTHHALDATDFSEYPELKKYGQEIVDRCKGAPLAAKALGGLLRSKHDPCEWEDVLNSKIWDIPEDKSSIFSVLRLSYNYLPSHLKRCFAYCSLFPKDYEFQERELVLLWMAEGLIQETKAKKPMEDLGGDYFRDLLNRSFFQQSSSYESLSFFQQSSSYESLFVMHDLMNDLAMWAAGDLCCRLEDQLGGSKQFEISTKVRHFLILNIQTIASISLMKMCI